MHNLLLFLMARSHPSVAHLTGWIINHIDAFFNRLLHGRQHVHRRGNILVEPNERRGRAGRSQFHISACIRVIAARAEHAVKVYLQVPGIDDVRRHGIVRVGGDVA